MICRTLVNDKHLLVGSTPWRRHTGTLECNEIQCDAGVAADLQQLHNTNLAAWWLLSDLEAHF